MQEINVPTVVNARLLAAETEGAESTPRCRQRQNAKAVQTEPLRPQMKMRPRCGLGQAGGDHGPLVLPDPRGRVLDGNKCPGWGQIRGFHDMQAQRIAGAVV